MLPQCVDSADSAMQAARRSSAGSESVAQTKRKQAESYGKYIRERGQKEEAREASKREVSRLEVRETSRFLEKPVDS